jgi:hypothetical protein
LTCFFYCVHEFDVLVENLEPVKEAKLEEKTNGHHETKADNQILERGNIVFMCKFFIEIGLLIEILSNR